MIVLDINSFEQWLVVVTGLMIKPVYMLLSLLLIIALWKQAKEHMVLLRWALMLFLAGEAFCAANFIFAGDKSAVMNVLHGAGMVGLSALLPLGLFSLLDRRVLHFSDEATCAMQKLCGRCWKHENISCGMQRLFIFAVPCFLFISLLPLTAPLKPMSYCMRVLESETEFVFSPVVMFWELRVFPLLAVVLFLVSLFFLLRGRVGMKRAEVVFFIGFGFMLYSLFRFFLLYSFEGLPHWANFWEEVTELMTMVGLGVFFLVFRSQLGLFPGKRK
ncbi:MAG: hypothetical protein GY765_20985 [bacterium]|nr:hypothetical protein [bacterium]